MQNKVGRNWIFAQIEGYKFRIIILCITSAINALLSVILVMCSKSLIDEAVAGNKQSMIIYGASLIGIVIVQMALSSLYLHLEMRIQSRLDIKIKNRLLKSIIHTRHEEVMNYHTGDFLNRLTTDVRLISEGIVSLIPTTVSVTVKLIGIIAALIYLQPYFTVIFILIGVFVFIIASFLRRVVKSLHKQVQETEGKIRSFLQEMLHNMLTIKIYNSSKHIMERMKQFQEVNYKSKMKRRNVGIITNLGFAFIFQLGYLYAFVWCARGLFIGTMTFGELTAIVQYVGQVSSPFSVLSSNLQKYYEMLASAERLIEIEQLPNDGQATEILDKTIKLIVFEHITFSYDNNLVLDDVSFEVPFGTKVMITGESGAGKSTLFKLILGLYKPDSGKVYIKYEDASTQEIQSVNEKLFAFVPQGNTMFSGTIKENITMFDSNVNMEDIESAIRTSMSESFIRTLADGVDSDIGESGLGLSEGQLQRLTIARAFASKQNIILLDEATSALDIDTERELYKNIEKMVGSTFFIITHRVSTCNICDYELMVKDGKVELKMEKEII